MTTVQVAKEIHVACNKVPPGRVLAWQTLYDGDLPTCPFRLYLSSPTLTASGSTGLLTFTYLQH